MKRYSLYILSCVAALLFFSACQDESLVEKRGEVTEGVPVDVKLSFESFNLDKVQTRADRGEEAENAVNEIYLFVFNKNKNLEYGHLHAVTEQTTSGSITLAETITSGEKYIVAIANPKTDAVQLDYSNVKTLDDLKQLQLGLYADVIQHASTSGFLMSGYWGTDASAAAANSGKCVIQPSSSTDGKVTVSDGSIYFRHVDSKIKFEVQLSEPARKEFIPKDWQVVNVPKSSYLLENPEAVAAVQASDFFATRAEKFEEMNISETRYLGGNFSFYMMENRKKALNPITDYADRERQNKTSEGLNEDFTNADPLSTYVVLRGTYYEYKENGEIEKSAEVRYTIHLGYVNNVASDFDSKRGTFYTYRVKIKGVKNIILEVESSEEGKEFKENQPGAEGDVIISDQNLLLDAHYEVKTITFYKDQLTNLSVAVKTPFESRTSAHLNDGYYRVYTGDDGAMAREGNLKDFEWVEFAKNEGASTKFQSYAVPFESKKLINVKQLMEKLYEMKEKDDKSFWTSFTEGGKTRYKVVYTVFVNEYYYTKNPKTEDAVTWKEFVNCENRQMHILCDTKFSYDQQSSLTKSNIMLNQRSIKTIYNKNDKELKTAWGIETINEDPNLVKTTGLNSTYLTETKTNGRYNTLHWYNELEYKFWSTYVNFATNKNKKEATAQYACFLRNRDLNGNGMIDPYEIRWYLPATNQLVGLWIGQDALPSETRLLQTNISGITEENRYNYHYISSNNVRFWTEEGVSTGSENMSNKGFNIRCARNLGYAYDNENEEVSSDSEAGEPEDYVTVTRDVSTFVTKVDLSKVDPAALRNDKFLSLAFHPEHGSGTLNYPYKKFTVSVEKKLSVKESPLSYANVIPKCPNGYGRLPNQRELALIAGYSTDSLGLLGAVTYSELAYKLKNNIIYTVAWNKTGKFNFLTLSTSNTRNFRCVKDVD